MLLTMQEREKFIEWLEMESETDKGIWEQMEKLKVPEVVIKKLKMEAAAALIIAKKLSSIEDQTISRG